MIKFHDSRSVWCCSILLLVTIFVRGAFSPKSIEPDQIISVSVGTAHSVLLAKSGAVYTFGLGAGGRLGVDLNGNVKIPTAISIPDNKKIAQISTGGDTNFLVADDGSVLVTGNQLAGKLGTGESAVVYVLTPTAITIPDSKKIVKSAAGPSHSLLLADDGSVFSFGNPTDGKLGNGDEASGAVTTPTAVSIPGNKKIVDISAANSHSILVAEDGTVFTMGKGSNGALCNGDTTQNVKVPTAITIPNNKKIVKACAGHSHSVLIAEDGTVLTCGSGTGGQLGNGKLSGTFSSPTEITIPSSKKIKTGSTAISSSISSLIAEDGTLYTFGFNNNGQLGLGQSGSLSVSTPTAVTKVGKKKIIQAAFNQDHAIIVSEHGTVFSMGSQSFGKLGNDVDDNRNVYFPLEIVAGLVVCECNGHGTCVAGSSDCICSGNFTVDSNCKICIQGYAGENCTEIMCNGISKENTTAVCNGHGQCVGPNTCECNYGWNKGSYCSDTSCFSLQSNSGQVCSGRGKCVEFNYCRCPQGYGGYKCQRQCDYCYLNNRL